MTVNEEIHEFLYYLMTFPLPPKWRAAEHFPKTVESVRMMLLNHQHAFLTWLVDLCQEGEWIFVAIDRTIYGYLEKTPHTIISGTDEVEISNDVVLRAFLCNIRKNLVLQKKITSKSMLTKSFKEFLGPDLFSCNDRGPRKDGPRHTYTFASMTAIKSHLEQRYLGIGFFSNNGGVTRTSGAIASFSNNEETSHPTSE